MHHPLPTHHPSVLGDPAVGARKLQSVHRDPIYRGFAALLGFWMGLMWWVLCAACAGACLVLWHAGAGMGVVLAVVAAFALVLALSGLLRTANLRAARDVFLRTWLRVALAGACELALAHTLLR